MFEVLVVIGQRMKVISTEEMGGISPVNLIEENIKDLAIIFEILTESFVT